MRTDTRGIHGVRDPVESDSGACASLVSYVGEFQMSLTP